MKARVVFALVALGGAALDLWSKWLAEARLGLRGHCVVLEGLLDFRCGRNKGVVWGLGKDWSGAPTFFLVLSLVAMAVILFLFLRTRRPGWLLTLALSLLLAGTIGNAYDRLAYEAVRDFLQVTFINWPIFNLADCYISVGAGALLVYLLFFDPKRPK